MVDFLIIRNKCDLATEYTNWIGEGMKAYLEGKGHSVTDLSDADASPEKVEEWLKFANEKTMRAVVALDHGSPGVFWGEKDGNIAQAINQANAEPLTKELQVYTLACSTNADAGLGETAVAHGCFSWLGYTEPVYAAKSQSFKECIWSYMEAMAEGKTMEQCEQALRQAYADRTSQSFIYQYNLDRLLLRKSANNMSINSHNRLPRGGAGYATRLDLDYIVGSTRHCVWAVVGDKPYYRWVNDGEIQTIIRPAFQAPRVWIQYDGSGKITRIRPIRS